MRVGCVCVCGGGRGERDTRMHTTKAMTARAHYSCQLYSTLSAAGARAYRVLNCNRVLTTGGRVDGKWSVRVCNGGREEHLKDILLKRCQHNVRQRQTCIPLPAQQPRLEAETLLTLFSSKLRNIMLVACRSNTCPGGVRKQGFHRRQPSAQASELELRAWVAMECERL